MQISVASDADIAVLSTIIGEIEHYYGGPPVPGDPDEIRSALFSTRPVATVLLAREGTEVHGFASFSLLWPAAGSGTSLFLKELYVRRVHRAGGVGRALMDRLQEIAAEAGCSRIEWLADHDNPSALGFYQAMGFKSAEGKRFFRSTL